MTTRGKLSQIALLAAFLMSVYFAAGQFAFAQEELKDIDYCGVNWLRQFFGTEAGNAAQVCEKASNGSPLASTYKGDKERDCFQGGKELGVGLFLVNLYKTDIAPGALSERDGKCVVADQGKLNDVVGKLVFPDINARTAAQLYSNNVRAGRDGWSWSSVAQELGIKGAAKSAPVSQGKKVVGEQTGAAVEAAPLEAEPLEEEKKPGEKIPLGIAQQIGNFYAWALGIGALLALGVLIFGGILYTVSAGNASRQEDAKGWLLGAVVGVLLLFGSYLVLNSVNPELTKLKDLELVVNEAAQSIRSVEDVPYTEGPNCDGYYDAEKAPKGNFADPGCEGAVTAANPDALDQFKDKVYQQLRQRDPDDANDLFAIIPCESAGTWSPNIWRDPRKIPHTPNPTGAWGLFQMGSVARHNDYGNGCSDIGQALWGNQIENSVCVINAVKASGKSPSAYWPTWRSCP